MSTADRKIGYYNFVFEKYRTCDRYFDRDLFKALLDYIFSLSSEQKIIRNEQYNKAIAIDAWTIDQLGNDYLIKVIFKSCKYNHSPVYVEFGWDRATQ